jgi:hypothetical protein
MGRRDVLQSSTYVDITGNWCQADLTDEDILWARRNLVPDKQGHCKFERMDAFTRSEDEPTTMWSLPKDWTGRVRFRRGEQHPWILVQMGERYRLRDFSQNARLRRDPELAPHVSFRKLSHGNAGVALGFLKEFGPLFLNDMTRKPLVWIDLNDFWRKHTRYVAILRLYEALDDYEQLLEAVLNVARNIETLDAAGPATLGSIPHTHKDTPYIRVVSIRPPEDYLMKDRDGDPFIPLSSLRNLARDLIQSELILHTHKDIGSSWLAVEEDDTFKFRPERTILSLWAGLWEMFGLDTWSGYGWKACQICGKYFYPPQRNSDCCTPAHQALWSKRVYARRVRQAKKQS